MKPVRLRQVSSHQNECEACEEDAAHVYGYTGTLWANSQGTSGQVREEGAAIECGYACYIALQYEQRLREVVASPLSPGALACNDNNVEAAIGTCLR